jgi:two-component system, OmpR family, response regulator
MRILIIEDERRLAAVLKHGLERAGYAADCAPDGLQGATLAEMHQDDYDLVVLDVMLPTLDGLSVCRRLRERGVMLPVLMLTARGTVDDKVRGLDAGADDYLVKPFAFAEFQARIRTLLRRPTVSLPASLEVGDLKLDPAARKAWLSGCELALTTKEFALLEFFMRNAGRVVTREQLIGHLWDYDFDSFSNVVDVHVKNLRKKLDEAGGKRLLATVRGVGYELDR